MKKIILFSVFFLSIMYPTLSGLDSILNLPPKSYDIKFKVLDWAGIHI